MQEDINVLEVLDCYYPKYDGPTLVITSYSNCFLKQNNGIIPTVIVPKFPKYVDNQDFEVFRTASMKSAEGYYAGIPAMDAKLTNYLKKKKIDLIHFHSPFTMGKYFAHYGKKHHIPTIFSFHTKFKDDFERLLKTKTLQTFMMKYIMKVINKADYVWTVSDGAREVLREYGYKKNIEVIRNGTDLIYPKNAEELCAKIDNLYHFAPDENVLLTICRIVENKNIDLCLEALKIAKEKGLKFKYLVVGEGSYLETLKENAIELGLENDVIFTGRIKERCDLVNYYLRSDLFLFPSTFDTQGLVVLESAGLKLPSLLTKGSAASEIVIDNENGFVADENAESWAERIIEILSDKEKLNAVSEKAFTEVYKTWDEVAEEVSTRYREIIDEYQEKSRQKPKTKTKSKIKTKTTKKVRIND